MNRLDLGKFYLTHDKIPANGAWLGPGAEFLNSGTTCMHIAYLDRVKLVIIIIIIIAEMQYGNSVTSLSETAMLNMKHSQLPIGVIYEGYRYPPRFGLGVPRYRTPLFQDTGDLRRLNYTKPAFHYPS